MKYILFLGITAGAALASPISAQAQPYVPGLEFLGLKEGAEIGDILAQLYVFGVAMAATAAFIMMVIGGVQYMLAGDRDPSAAKERIRNALWGLALALASWLILSVINPQLLQKIDLKPIDIIRLKAPTPSGMTTPSGLEGVVAPGEFAPVAQTGYQCPSTGRVYAYGDQCQTQCGGLCSSVAPPPGGFEIPQGKWLPPVPTPPSSQGTCNSGYQLRDGLCFPITTSQPCYPASVYCKTSAGICALKGSSSLCP